ncbi:diadenylate cyclase CdaA [Pelolinea submarina]|jgi:diadenylate cyclase|uniref:Diadenylate cyclase n=1 Tax=Pelolinea submarina TaxID=913107 RepID=A0A347ZQG4_9CHLR|nr:diadenylate cyclase CdaA [Pelolinea submarina]REG06125.1 diadenylate cyclase [Pelolinea submarina]BBB47545.1 diadenylate cyclase [Pelolinea submarina]
MANLFSEIAFLIQRFDWLSLLDIILVSAIFYALLLLFKDTQAQTLLRGVIFLVIAISLVTTLINLPAFSWLISNTLPSLLFTIPVIFMPELRRALERLGRAGSSTFLFEHENTDMEKIRRMVKAVVSASSRLSVFRQGALIVLQRKDSLREYEDTGVKMGALVSPELLLQIFYPNTPLHDGAAILVGDRVSAAACVMPLSSSGVLNSSPERQMGLRHRAALGISEATDAIAVVVSEETGSISLAHRGRILRRISADKLENVLMAFYQQQIGEQEKFNLRQFILAIFKSNKQGKD